MRAETDISVVDAETDIIVVDAETDISVVDAEIDIVAMAAACGSSSRKYSTHTNLSLSDIAHPASHSLVHKQTHTHTHTHIAPDWPAGCRLACDCEQGDHRRVSTKKASARGGASEGTSTSYRKS